MRVYLALGIILLSSGTADAVTRYAGLGGSDANTCVQSQNIATPKLTYASAKTCIAAGDTLLLLAGSTFNESLSITGLTGTSIAPITIKVNSGTVTFNAQSLTTSCRTLVASSTTHYVTIDRGTGALIWSGSGCANGLIGNTIDGATNLTIRGVEVVGYRYSGLYIQNATNITVEYSNIHDQVSPTCIPSTRYYGVYVHDGTNIVLSRNVITGNPGGGVQVYPGPLNGVTLDRNDIHGNNSCTTSPIGGVVVGTDSGGGNISGVVISRNIIYGNGTAGGGGGIRLYATTRTQTGTKILENTIYDNRAGNTTGYGVNVQGGPSGTIIQNNHIVGNETGQITDAGTGTVQGGNRTTGTILDCTPSTSDFTQKAGSPCIDAGVDDGLPSNGLPDIGAFQSFTAASCQVPFGLANTIQITFTSNVNLLGSTLTTFTARRNGANNALTGAATKIGDTIVSLPLTTTYIGGDTADWSWASGGFTDNAQIGGTLNQPFLPVTNQSCTNNAGGAPTHVLTQARYQFRGVRGPETSTDIRLADNVPVYEVQQGGAARVRFVLTDSVSNAPPTAFFLRYSLNAGPYTVAPDTFSADNIGFCGADYPGIAVVNATPTTNQITAIGGTFVPGGVILTSNAIPTISGFNAGYKTEMEYCVKFDTDAAGDYLLRLYQQDGTALTYTQTPQITIVPPHAPAGIE